MKKLVLLALIFTTFIGCNKDKSETVYKMSQCELDMLNRFKNDLTCTEKGVMEVNLYSGVYHNKVIYFTMTMCPNCNTTAPLTGYTCDGTKVSINNFNNTVTEIKEVYNSCKQYFQ